MKQYRLKLYVSTIADGHKWTEWRTIDTPFHDKDILTIQFDFPLTLKESEEFFKHYEVK